MVTLPLPLARYFLQGEKELGKDWQLMRAGTPGCPEVSRWHQQSALHCTALLLVPPTHQSQHDPAYRPSQLSCTAHAAPLLLANHSHSTAGQHKQHSLGTQSDTPHTLLHRQIEDWLASTLPEGGRVGIDPFCHTVDSVRRLQRKLEAAGGAPAAACCA
jgi:hypothetical protein